MELYLKMKKIFISALLAPLLLNAQSLKSVVSDAISTNPTIKERFANFQSTKNDIAIAKADYYPKLDLILGVGKEDTKRSDQPNQPNESFDLSVYQNSLTLTQNIFRCFATDNKVKKEEYKSASASFSYVEKVNSIAFDTVDAYIKIIKQKELLDNSIENIKINEEIFTKVKKLYDSGLTTLSEVNKIESSLSLAKSNYIVQQNTLLDYKYNFEKLTGINVDINNFEPLKQDIALPSSLQQALDYAAQNNPSIIVSDYNVKQLQAAHSESKASYCPEIDLEVSENMNKNLSGVEGKDDRFRAMLYLKYNIFKGFADKELIQKNINEISRENQNKDSLKRDVKEQLNLAWASNEKLSEQLEHLNKYKDYAEKTLNLYQKEYDLGRRSLLDLLSAQNDFIQAKAQIINSQHTKLFAKYRILDSMGTLVTTLLDDKKDLYAPVEIN